MREVFGEILEKISLIIFELLPFFDMTLQMQYLGKYKC